MLEHIKAVHNHFLHYRIEYPAVQAESIMQALEPDSLAIVQGIRAINALIPPIDIGPDNPNTGVAHHVYEIGRSYSLVMWVIVRTVYMPRGYDYDLLRIKLDRIGREMHVEDFHFYRDKGSYKARFWWD